MMYLAKTPEIVKPLGKNLVWNISTEEKVIFLTFDDGPIPEITPWVLETLKKYDAKGTFFCVGDNVRKHPEVFKQVIEEGHLVGNHTFNHMNGWKTNNFTYFKNALQCDTYTKTRLFRPPYGKITRQQSIALRNRFDIIMWDVLSGDFDQKITPEKCLLNVIHNTESGSIIVFHDSKKAFQNLSYTLPKVLEYYKEKGFRFETLDQKYIYNANPKLNPELVKDSAQLLE